ncbi:MAG: hypothetical protein AAGG08_18325 [Actinomycetota bacterium]
MVPRPGRPATTSVSPSQIVEALVFAPIGLGAAIIAETPRRVRQARSDLVAARFLGEMAVTQGVAEVQKRRAASTNRPDTAPTSARSAATSQRSAEAPGGSGSDAAADDSLGAASTSEAVSSDELAIPDYDTVPAIDVVMQLADLDAAERAAIGVYERSHRGRRTILGKLAQLESGT